jgi:hypothetical protein
VSVEEKQTLSGTAAIASLISIILLIIIISTAAAPFARGDAKGAINGHAAKSLCISNLGRGDDGPKDHRDRFHCHADCVAASMVGTIDGARERIFAIDPTPRILAHERKTGPLSAPPKIAGWESSWSAQAPPTLG